MLPVSAYMHSRRHRILRLRRTPARETYLCEYLLIVRLPTAYDAKTPWRRRENQNKFGIASNFVVVVRHPPSHRTNTTAIRRCWFFFLGLSTVSCFWHNILITGSPRESEVHLHSLQALSPVSIEPVFESGRGRYFPLCRTPFSRHGG